MVSIVAAGIVAGGASGVLPIRDAAVFIVLAGVAFQNRLGLTLSVDAVVSIAAAGIVAGGAAGVLEIPDAAVFVILAGVAFQQRLGQSSYFYTVESIVAADATLYGTPRCVREPNAVTPEALFFIPHTAAEHTTAEFGRAQRDHDNIRGPVAEMFDGNLSERADPSAGEFNNTTLCIRLNKSLVRAGAANGQGFINLERRWEQIITGLQLDNAAGLRLSDGIRERFAGPDDNPRHCLHGRLATSRRRGLALVERLYPGAGAAAKAFLRVGLDSGDDAGSFAFAQPS
ncbi:hypothetical protein HRbin36_02518 [bacterium HR36]|nr:hypothetical protein HRbin36_02518 [bacterium HR36]